MRERSLVSMMTVAIAGAAVSAGISLSITRTLAQAPAASATAPAAALKTPWGEPDLQGIWTDETETPLQRPAKYASQEFFTAAQRAELDEVRAAQAGKDKRAERGTELDVALTTTCSSPTGATSRLSWGSSIAMMVRRTAR
jgi:hypothetical protein